MRDSKKKFITDIFHCQKRDSLLFSFSFSSPSRKNTFGVRSFNGKAGFPEHGRPLKIFLCQEQCLRLQKTSSSFCVQEPLFLIFSWLWQLKETPRHVVNRRWVMEHVRVMRVKCWWPESKITAGTMAVCWNYSPSRILQKIAGNFFRVMQVFFVEHSNFLCFLQFCRFQSGHPGLI